MAEEVVENPIADNPVRQTFWWATCGGVLLGVGAMLHVAALTTNYGWWAAPLFVIGGIAALAWAHSQASKIVRVVVRNNG